MGEFEVPQSRSYESRPVTYSEMARYAGAQDASAMVGVEVPPAAVEAVLSHRWGASNLPPDAHAEHNYYGGCAVCRGDVPAVLALAAPHIAAAALRQAAEELWDRTDGLAQIYARWLRHRADQFDGSVPQAVTTDG